MHASPSPHASSRQTADGINGRYPVSPEPAGRLSPPESRAGFEPAPWEELPAPGPAAPPFSPPRPAIGPELPTALWRARPTASPGGTADRQALPAGFRQAEYRRDGGATDGACPCFG